MTRIPDRDQAVEPLLRTIHRGDAAGPSETATTPCPDASELAAWADADLEPGAAAIMDAHLAACERCQTILATLVRTAPAPAVVLPFWHRPSVALPIVSIGAAAAAVLAIAVWSRPARTRVPESAVTTVAEATPAPARAPAPIATPPALQLDAKTRGQAPARRSATATDLPAAPRQSAKAQADVATSQEASAKPAAPPATMATPPPAATPPPLYTNFDSVAKPPAAAAGATTAAAPSASRVSAFDSTGAVQWNLEGGNIADAASLPFVAEFSAPSADLASTASQSAASGAGGGGRSGGRGGGGRAGGRVVGALARPGSPSDVPARWRVLTSGAVMKSSDAGVTWQPVVLDANPHVLTGVATSSQVCWLAGKSGVVLRATDGEHFARVDLPVPADVTAIAAGINGVTASTAEGTFTTVDGKEWKKQSR